jgi:hypothetical protein
MIWTTNFPTNQNLKVKWKGTNLEHLKTWNLDQITQIEGGGKVTWRKFAWSSDVKLATKI